jgi:hypothetical protein
MIRRTMRTMVFVTIALGISGCSFSRVNSSGSGSVIPVKVIAVMPGGLIADAVAVELANKGFTIVDASATTNRVRRENTRETEIIEPESIAQLRSRGVDAIVQVRSTTDRRANLVSATARMTSAHNSALLAAVSWQNANAGEVGSIADRTVKKGVSDAAADIANELVARVKPGS